MANTPQQILNQLKGQEYQPVYFLQGDEPYYIDMISDYIEQHVLSEAEKGFNQMIMYGKDSSVPAVLSNAKRFPMMAPRQVVIVKEAQELPDINRQDSQKLLIDYLNQPLPSTVLVFCHKYKTLDGRKALAKAVAKQATLVDCKKMYDNQIAGWILDFVQNEGYQIEPQTAQLLSDYIGNNLERLNSEIKKVMINLPTGGTINSDLVQKYVGISKDFNVFELQKALTHKDNLKAQQIVQYFGANPKLNPVIPIIAVLFGFFSKLLLIHYSKHHSERSLAQELRIRPFFMKEYLQAARNFTKEKVVQNIHHLRIADLQVKGVGSAHGDHGEILKELIFKLMH